jgi:hypothetical protein
MSNALPSPVQAILNSPLQGSPQQPVRLSEEQIKQLTPAQRLDYSRLWDQSRMPSWKDPRGG